MIDYERNGRKRKEMEYNGRKGKVRKGTKRERKGVGKERERKGGRKGRKAREGSEWSIEHRSFSDYGGNRV